MKLTEKKQKKTKRILKNFFGFITILCYSIFFYHLSNINFEAAPSGYAMGAFIGASAVPAMCWIIYGVVVLYQKDKLNRIIQEKIDTINSSSSQSQEFNMKLNALKGLLEVNAITQDEFELKRKLLIRDSEKSVLTKDNLTFNRKQREILDAALVAGVITQEEYARKVEKLK
jgi:hypothetical protein